VDVTSPLVCKGGPRLLVFMEARPRSLPQVRTGLLREKLHRSPESLN
jgi:hypothetical protein